MSFILDALRKSEHARQHQKGPALAEVPIVARKAKSNGWAAAAVALLVVNLVAIGVVMLRKAQRSETEAPAPAAAVASNVVTNPGTPALSSTASSHAEPTLTADPQLAITQSATPRPAAQEPAGNPLEAELSESASGPDPGMAQRAARVPDGPPAVSTTRPTKRGSVVYATVPEAGDAPYSAAPYVPESAPQAAAPDPVTSSLPLADELVARGTVPPLHLDLHVYSNVVQQRFIFVNSRKYKEGDTLQEGPVVEQITSDGAVLNLRGTRFKLARE